MGVSLVNAFVFSFHMPLFFLISGYFFKADASKVWRNSKRLIAAYLWTVVAGIVLSEFRTLAEVLIKGDDPFMLIKNVGEWGVAGLYGSGARADCFGLNLPRIGAVWFLLALMWGGTTLYQQVTGFVAADCGRCATLPCRLALRKNHLAALVHPSGYVCHSLSVHRLQSADV